MKFKKYLEENKDKEIVVKIDQKKSIRIPTAPSSQYFKDKSKYNRKEKYKRNYKED